MNFCEQTKQKTEFIQAKMKFVDRCELEMQKILDDFDAVIDRLTEMDRLQSQKINEI